MLAKVLVFSVALAAASCQEYKAHHYYAPQEQRQYVEFVPVSSHHQPAPIYEAQSSEVQGHGHEQEISQNAIQYSHSQQGSEGAQEHYQPLYQYVKTEPESPSHHYPAPEHQQTHAIQVHNQLSHDEHSHYPAHEPARHYPHHVESHDAPHQHQQLKESYDSHEKPIDYYAYPKYQYEYKVEDPHTGDNKYQHEVRDGDMVKGVYSLQEADGSIRTVEYSSDKHNGFTAVVKHSAPGQHVEFQSHHKH